MQRRLVVLAVRMINYTLDIHRNWVESAKNSRNYHYSTKVLLVVTGSSEEANEGSNERSEIDE